MLSGVCIFLTIYLFLRFTEIQKINKDLENRIDAIQNDMKVLLEVYPIHERFIASTDSDDQSVSSN